MTCTNCGHPLPQDSRFCPACGAVQNTAPVQNAPTPIQAPAQPSAQETMQAAAQNMQAAKASVSTMMKNPPRWLIIAVIAVAVLGIWFFFIRKDPVKDLKEHVFLEYAEYAMVPFEDVASAMMPGANWSSNKLSDTNYQVTLSGFCLVEESMMSLTFSMNYVNDTPLVQLVSCSMGSWRTTDPSDLYWLLDEFYDEYSEMYRFGW